jgi:uncharacterized membrane protein
LFILKVKERKKMNDETTGWAGWAYFAGVYLIIVGIFQMISGFVTLFRQDVLVLSSQNALFVNLSTYGWALLLIGLVMLLTGFGVIAGQVWARTIGVLLAGLAAIVNFLFIPVYPIWSIIVLVVDVVVIYALIAHGGELKTREV